MKSKRDDIKIDRVMVQHRREVFAPPPPGFPIHSPFTTVHEWLSAVCDAEPPAVPISIFSFGVFESPDEWLLFVIGENDYREGQLSGTRIDFKPSLMYFLLPREQYAGLSSKVVRAQLARELEAFTQTEKFRNSFLATANSAEWNGDAFWYR